MVASLVAAAIRRADQALLAVGHPVPVGLAGGAFADLAVVDLAISIAAQEAPRPEVEALTPIHFNDVVHTVAIVGEAGGSCGVRRFGDMITDRGLSTVN